MMDDIADAFAEWERRRRLAPDNFPEAMRDEQSPEEYGRACASYLADIIHQLRHGE